MTFTPPDIPLQNTATGRILQSRPGAISAIQVIDLNPAASGLL
jgi:hypothetical protein